MKKWIGRAGGLAAGLGIMAAVACNAAASAHGHANSRKPHSHKPGADGSAHAAARPDAHHHH